MYATLVSPNIHVKTVIALDILSAVSLDKMITYGKKGTLVSRRKALAFLHNDNECVKKVFNELAPRYKDRNGGYTRILKMNERKGDNALEVIIELV